MAVPPLRQSKSPLIPSASASACQYLCKNIERRRSRSLNRPFSISSQRKRASAVPPVRPLAKCKNPPRKHEGTKKPTPHRGPMERYTRRHDAATKTSLSFRLKGEIFLETYIGLCREDSIWCRCYQYFLSVRPAQRTKTFISFVASYCETYLCGSAALLLYGAGSVRENNCLLVRNSRATSFGWRFSPSTA